MIEGEGPPSHDEAGPGEFLVYIIMIFVCIYAWTHWSNTKEIDVDYKTEVYSKSVLPNVLLRSVRTLEQQGCTISNYTVSRDNPNLIEVTYYCPTKRKGNENVDQ